MGKSAVSAGISRLSHRVNVQPSATAEHTTLDSSATHRGQAARSNTHNSQGHTEPTLECAHICCSLPRGPQGHPKQVSTSGGNQGTELNLSTLLPASRPFSHHHNSGLDQKL